jgi:hypothetical protein
MKIGLIDRFLEALGIPAQLQKIRAMKQAAKEPGVFGNQYLKPVETNPIENWKRIQSQEGATCNSYVGGPTTYTLGAASTERTVKLWDADAELASIATAHDGYFPKYENCIYSIHCKSSAIFEFQPFIALLENGETITPGDTALADPLSAMEGAVGAEERLIIPGPLFESIELEDSKFRVHGAIDIAPFLNLYSIHYANAEFREQNPLVFKVGMVLIGIANQQIQASVAITNVYALKKHNWGQVQ